MCGGWCRCFDWADAGALCPGVQLQPGQQLVCGLLGVAVAPPHVVLQPVRGLVALGADGARGARPVHAVLVPDVA